MQKARLESSVIEAVDCLSDLVEIDILDAPNNKLWSDPSNRNLNQEKIREVFLAISRYIQLIAEKGKGLLREEFTQKGLQALLLLVAEAAKKIDQCTEIFEKESVTQLKEYKELQHLYLTKIARNFGSLAEIEEEWPDAWGSGKVELAELKTLETVRNDKEYELFFIRKEDGTPYFHKDLLYHMLLVTEFDSLLSDRSMDDPFLRIRLVSDKEAHIAAKEILKTVKHHVDDFFKDSLKFKQISFVIALSKASIALMLAANTRNLMQNASGKMAWDYYSDFHFYLREALNAGEYQKLIAKASASSERFLQISQRLVHALCKAFFTRTNFNKDIIDLIYLMIEKEGKVKQYKGENPAFFWNQLQEKDEKIRSFFKRYPNGPLLKTMSLLSKQTHGFDPLRQHNAPHLLFSLRNQSLEMDCIRLPCPTAQMVISKAVIVEEFQDYLRALKAANQRQLLINLQDRTSWQEHSRSKVLESCQEKPGLHPALIVVTFPKDTDFYNQTGPYLEWDDAKEFIKLAQDQITHPEQSGFYFSPEVEGAQLAEFSQKALRAIHTLLFDSKDRLTYKNRIDFIEIFYLLLALKCIDALQPAAFSFVCKDGIDVSVIASTEILALLKMMQGSAIFTKEEGDQILAMIYEPAIVHRERAIDKKRIERMISALSALAATFEAHTKKAMETFRKLYNPSFFSALQIDF